MVLKTLAERGFDPRTPGLWAQHASTAPLCYSYNPIQSNPTDAQPPTPAPPTQTEKATGLSRQFSFNNPKFQQLQYMAILVTLSKTLLLVGGGAPPFTQGQVRTKLDFLLS